MKKELLLAAGLLVGLNSAVIANDVTDSGKARWIVVSGAESKEDAVEQAKQKTREMEKDPEVMPSDVNVLLPTNYVKDSFSTSNVKFYISEYYSMEKGPLYEVNAILDYQYDRREKK